MIPGWKALALGWLFLSGVGSANPARRAAARMVLIPGGSYLPFFINQGAPDKKSSRDPVSVSSFWLDRYPVTNQEYLEFVRTNPGWRRSRIKPVFSDGHYLEDWRSDLALRSAKDGKRPVTFVSWFSAEAYCEWKGKELPTVDQWEYAAWDRGRGRKLAREEILAWYGKPSSSPPDRVGSTRKNGFGVYDLFGLVWEWTLDFNSEVQADGSKSFCGSGSLGALDPTDYVSFMRSSFRNSLKANYTIGNLGFRCAKGVVP